MSLPLFRRSRVGRRAGALTAVALGGLLTVTACSAPGGDASTTTSPGTTASSASAQGSASGSATAAPGTGTASGTAAAATPGCGTAPVTLSGVLRDRFPAAEGARRRVHQAVPERDLEHPRGPVRRHHRRTPRALSPTTRRTSCGCRSCPALAKDDLLKNLDSYATAFGWDKWPASQLVADAGGRRRHPRHRAALRDGSQLQHDRRLLQQEAGRADRHDAAADDAGRAGRRCCRRRRRPASRRSRSSTAARPVGSPSRCRISWPSTGRPARSTTGSSTRRAPPSTRRRTWQAAAHLQQWIKAGLLRQRTSTPSTTPTMMSRLHRREEPVHLRRRLGVGEPRQADGRATSASS